MEKTIRGLNRAGVSAEKEKQVETTADQIGKLLPAKYAAYLAVLGVLIPWLGRAFTALRCGGGLVGVYRAILYGSTTIHNPTPSAREAAGKIPVLILFFALAFSASAQTPTNAVQTPTNAVQLLGLPPSLAQISCAVENALADAGPYETNSIIDADVGGLYDSALSKGKQYGAFTVLTLWQPAQQMSVGLGGAYIGGQWLDANMSIKIGTTTSLPYIGKVYAWASSGPDYSFKARAIGAYNFAGLLKNWDIGKQFYLGVSYGVGNISTLPGVIQEFGIHLSRHF